MTIICSSPVQYEYANFKGYTCIAFEFVKKQQINSVYAWNDKCKFIFGYNCSLNGGIYEKLYMINDSIIHKTVAASHYFESMPLYAPLEY